MKGEYNFQINSNWYELNLNLTLGTIASGIGPSNMAYISSFLSIKNYQNLKGRFFKNMELTIGAILRKIVNESIEKATDEEVRLTLNDKQKQ